MRLLVSVGCYGGVHGALASIVLDSDGYFGVDMRRGYLDRLLGVDGHFLVC
jgi:hypothetical protein